MTEILYNEIYPKGATTKNIVAKSKDVKYAKAGTTIVYDTFEEYTYGTPVITVEYKTVLSRNGGSIKPTVTYSQTRTKRGYSERAYESETISGTVESFTATGKILNSSEATIDTSNGTVSRDSLGTTYKSATWNIMEVTVTATINGVSASGTGIAKMQSNTYTDSGGVTTYSDVVKGSITHGYISAAGGSATATATAGSQKWYTSEIIRTFQTSATEVIKAAESGTNTIQGTTLTVSKDSKGTDISNRTVAGTKTVTWAGQGNKSATGTLYVYQNANYVTELTLSGGGLAYDTFTAAGTTKTPKTSTSKTVTFKFTSGSTTTTVPSSTYGSLSRAVSYGMTTATGFTLNSSSTGSITASNNKSTSARSTTAYRYEKATWTPSSSYPDANTINSSQGSNSCTISQSKGYYSYSSWSVSISASPTSGISAAGGSSTVTASASRTYGWNGATSGVGTQSGTIKLSIPSAVSGSSLSGTASGSTLTWSANYSTSARGVKVRATCQENTSVYKEVTITQNGDTKSSTTTEYSVSISANRYTSSTNPCSASGGSATLTYSGSTRERYDWVSGNVTYSEWTAVTPKISGSATGFTRDGTSVTISSQGAGTKNARSVTYTAKVGTASKSVTIYQQANAVTSTAYKFSTFSLSKTSFTAAGGSATLSMVVQRQYTYTSTSKGDWTTITPSSGTLSVSAGTGGSVGSISYGSTSTCTITVAAYTDTSSNRTISISGNYNSGSATASTSITQTKDAISSYGDISLTKGSVSVIPAKGGTVTSSGSSASQTVYYVSGRTRAGSVTVTEGSKTAGSKGTTISNQTSVGTLTISASGEGSKTASGTLTVYQSANLVTAVTYTPADPVTSQRHFYYGGACVAAGGGTKAATLNGNSILTFSSGSTKTGSSHTGVSISFSRTFTKTGGVGSVDASGTITFDNNKSTSMRYCYVSSTLTIAVKHDDAYSSGGTKTTTSTGETSCCQAAGYYSYAAWTVSISANPTTISAAGGSSTITASASRTYGWNGTTSGVGTQNGTVTLSIPTTTGASLSGNTLTWTANTSTTVERSIAVTATCKEDTSKTKSVTVKQNKDTISYYNAPTFDMWWSSGAGNNGTPVSAAGGTSAAPTYSVSQTATYVSGTVRSVTPSITSAVFSLNDNTTVSTAEVNSSTGAVTFGSAGTSEQGKEHVEVLLTLVSHGKTGTDIGWCYQAANTYWLSGVRIVAYQPDSSWLATGSWSSIPAGGHYLGVYGYYCYTWSSGKNTESGAGHLRTGLTFTKSMAEAWTNGGIHVLSRGTSYSTSTRSGSVYWTHGSFTSNSLSFTQKKNVITSVSVTSTPGTITGTTFTAANSTKTTTSTGASATAKLTFSSGSSLNTNYNTTTYGTWTFHGYSWLSNATYATLGTCQWNSLTVTMAANKTTSSRSATITRKEAGFTFTLSSSYNDSATSGTSAGTQTTCTVTQNADSISSYENPTFDLYYTRGNGSAGNVVKASGGTVNPSINSFSQTVNWVSGNKTYITDYTGATLSYSKGDTNGKASLTLGTDGKVTVGSLDTTLQNYIYPVLKVTLSITLNGKTGSDEGWVGQDANYVTSVSPQVISSSYDHFYYSGSVAASGGYKDPIGNGASTLTFSSGSTYYSSSAGSHCGGTISYSRSYSLPTTTGASINSSGRVTWTANTSTSKRSATVSSTLTVTYTHPSGINNGKTVSGTLNGTATCSQNADSITNSTVSYSGLKCTLTNNLTASGGSATVKVTTLKITTHTWASGKNPTYEYVNNYDVTSSATKTIDHATLFNTSGAVIEASTRFSISGATVSHSSMLDKVGIDKVCVKAVFSGLTARSDYAGVQNSRTDRKELTNVSVSYANASYVGGVNIAPSKSATYKVTPTYTSGFSGTTTTSTVTPNIDSYSITGTGCSKGSTTGYIIWSSNPNTASRSATITGTVAHQSITSSFSTTAWQAAKPANTYGCKVTFVNKTSCVAQITFTNCETSFVSIPPNSTQYYTLIKAQGVSGSVIYASVSTPGTCTLKLSITGFYCMSPHTSTTCNITT